MGSREMFVKLTNIIGWARASQLLHKFRSSEEPFAIARLGHHKMSQKVTHGHTPKFEVPLTHLSATSISFHLWLRSASPLYIPCNPTEGSTLEVLVHKLYEKFDKVVIRLITQVRSLIVYASMGECNEEGIKTRCGPILTNTECLL